MVAGATKATEISSVWAILNEVISDNLTDPAEPPRKKSGDWIRNGFPNPGDFCTKGGWKFPLVIIRQSKISDEQKVIDQSKDLVIHSVSIECSAETRLQAAQLSEQIRNILKVTASDDLNRGTVHLTGIDGSAEDFDFIGSGIKFYTYTIDYRFQRLD